MSDKAKNSSGDPAESKKSLRPTAIPASGGGSPKSPTKIGDGGSMKPTAIPTQIAPDASQKASAMKPTTVIPAAVKAEAVTPVVSAPTAIPGSQKRISVTTSQLEKLSAAKPEVIVEAMKLVQSVDVNDMTDRIVVFWGCDLQKAYGDLVMNFLKLIQADVLEKVSDRLSRTLEILGLINLRKVCGLGGGHGLLANLFKMATTAIDSWDELEDALRELRKLISYMSGKMDRLLELKGQLESASAEIEGTCNTVEASALAAQFLSEYFRAEKSDTTLASSFLDRAMSLTQTAVQIHTSAQTRKTQIEQPLLLIKTIQNVALVMIPDLIGMIVALKTVAESGNASPTEVDETSEKITDVMERLKGKDA